MDFAMKTNINKTSQSDELLFDRLVDGELNETERRALLSRLDDEPGGWRRCALAFLQAQCWKQSMGVYRRGEVSERIADGTRSVPATKRSSWPGWTNAVLAMAASFLVAMWIGAVAQRMRTSDAISPMANQVAATSPQPSTSMPTTAANPWRLVTVSNAAQPGATMQLPAVEREKIDEQWLRSVPPAIPEDVRAALARTGHQVQERRQLVPVPLKDGRRLMVPVDQVEVQYVGNKTY
jgi:hypothetical protein